MQAPRSAIHGLLTAPTALNSGTNATETTGPDDYVIIRPLAPNQQRDEDEVSDLTVLCCVPLLRIVLCIVCALHCDVFVLCIVSLTHFTLPSAFATPLHLPGRREAPQACECK